MSASITLGPDIRFPVGTVMKAVVRAENETNAQTSAAPGPFITSATIGDAGTWTFGNLAFDTAYFAVAQVAGTWRYSGFITGPDPSLTVATIADMQAMVDAATAGISDTVAEQIALRQGGFAGHMVPWVNLVGAWFPDYATDGDFITDRSKSGHNLQDGGSAPTQLQSSINGLGRNHSVMEFGPGDTLEAAFTLSSPVTLLLVAKDLGTDPHQPVGAFSDDTLLWVQMNTTSVMLGDAGPTRTVDPTSKFHLYSCVFNGGASSLQLDDESFPNTAGSVGGGTCGGIKFGDVDGSGVTWQFAGALLYNDSITAPQKFEAENFLFDYFALGHSASG